MTVTGPNFFVLNAGGVKAALPMSELISAISEEFVRSRNAPKRTVIELTGERWVIMPSFSTELGLVCKVVNVALQTRANGYPLISGALILLSAQGDVRGIIDAGAVNARRTAAVAAWATSLLARSDAKVLALFGVGSLAEPHIEAINLVRPLEEIRVVSATPEHAQAFARRLQAGGWNIRADSPAGALLGADIVSTCTTSPLPVFLDEMLSEGTHINAMGQYRPDRREIPSASVARSKIVVETRDSAWSEAGELIISREEGLIDDSNVLGELTHPEKLDAVRTSERDITLFKSVGNAAADSAAVRVILNHLDSSSS